MLNLFHFPRSPFRLPAVVAMPGLLKVRKGQVKAKKCLHTPPPPVVAEINRLAETWKKRLGFWKPSSSNKTFTLGSDCAGYGSELLALRLLGLQARVKLLMLCEASPCKKALHKVMVEQCGFDDSECKCFDDIFLRRNDDKETPVVDLYVAGYPCPAFSRIGKRQGCGEKRGVITLRGLHYVASKRPRALLLEQVSALMDKTHRHVWQFLLKILRLLEYEVVYSKTNTRDMGIPQSRERLYVLAVCRESLRNPLTLPDTRRSHPDLHTFLDKDIVGSEVLTLPKYEQILGQDLWTKGYVLDVAASEKFQSVLHNACPCLTKTRCKQDGFYCPKLRRRLTSMEIGRLQGLPKTIITAMLRESKSLSLPKRSFEEAVGDAMSVNVLQTMLRRLLHSAGFAKLTSSKDWWLLCPSDRCYQLSDSLWAMHGK